MSSNKDLEDEKVNMLLDTLNVTQLSDGAVFELDSLALEDAFEEALENERLNNAKVVQDNIDLLPSAESYDVVEELRGFPGTEEFESIAGRMTSINNDSRLKKLILRHGVGPVIPKSALVELHYTAYYEFCDEPFDSTYFRRTPFKYIPGVGDCIAGLNVAISTMKKREIAQFLIHPDLAFGKLGAPPRIPPNAELLYEVEILSYIDGVEIPAKEFGGELENTNALKTAEAKHQEGNIIFKKHNYADAIIKYKKALSLAWGYSPSTNEDATDRSALTLSLCTNLALCYIKSNNLAHGYKMCERALEIKPNHCKALFYMGRVLLMKGDFESARAQLLKAHQIEPTNNDINKEILNLEKRLKDYLAETKKISERMFPQPKTTEKTASEDAISTKWKLYFTNFINNDNLAVINLPLTFTAKEIETIEGVGINLGLIVAKGMDKLTIKKQPLDLH